MVGTVVRVSDSHGLCYQIQYDDGKTCWYEPYELLACATIQELQNALMKLVQKLKFVAQRSQVKEELLREAAIAEAVLHKKD